MTLLFSQGRLIEIWRLSIHLPGSIRKKVTFTARRCAVNLADAGGKSKVSASLSGTPASRPEAIIVSLFTLHYTISTSPPRQKHHHDNTSHYISFVYILSNTATTAKKAVLTPAIPPAGRPRQSRRGKDRCHPLPSWPPPLYGARCSLEWPCGMRRIA